MRVARCALLIWLCGKDGGRVGGSFQYRRISTPSLVNNKTTTTIFLTQRYDTHEKCGRDDDDDDGDDVDRLEKSYIVITKPPILTLLILIQKPSTAISCGLQLESESLLRIGVPAPTLGARQTFAHAVHMNIYIYIWWFMCQHVGGC